MSLYTNMLLNPNTRVATLENSSTKGIDYRTDFEQLLEFHDEIYTAQFNCGNSYYKAILESDEVLNEGVFGAISAFISIIINTIRSMFNIIFGGESNSSSSNDSSSGGNTITKAANTVAAKVSQAIKTNKTAIERSKDTFESMYKSNKLTGKKVNMRIYKFGLSNGQPIEITEENIIPSEQHRALLAKANEDFDDFFAMIKGMGGTATHTTDATNDTIDNAYKKVIESYNEKKNAIGKLKPGKYQIFTPENEEVNADVIYQQISYINIYDQFISQLKKYNEKNFPTVQTALKKLEELKSILDNQEKNTTDVNDKRRIAITRPVLEAYEGVIITYMAKIREFVSQAQVALNNQYSDLTKAMRYMTNTNSEGQEGDTVGGEVAEQAQLEAAILDEQFSNCLAAIYKDLKWSYMDAYRQGYVNEAVILSENSIDKDKKLVELNEAIGTKVKSAFNNAVAKIRELFAKFMEKLRANFTSTKNYLDKYKKYILGTTIAYNYKGKDILAGMYRVMNFTIPAFDYMSIKDSLIDPQTFFMKQLQPLALKTNSGRTTARNITVNVENSNQTLSQIGEWFKQFFGCAGEDGEITANDVQNSIKDIYDFMYDISKIEKSINDSIKNIEGLRDRALKQAGVEIVQPQQGTTESMMYIDHMPVLLEDWGAPQQQNNNQAQTTTNTNNNGVSSQMTNVASTSQKDANGQEQYGVGQTVKEEVDAKCNVYIQTVTKVLQAKLTAVEFLRNEFMALFRNLVQRNVEGNASPNGDTVNNTSAMPGVTQPQQNQQTANNQKPADQNPKGGKRAPYAAAGFGGGNR